MEEDGYEERGWVPARGYEAGEGHTSRDNDLTSRPQYESHSSAARQHTASLCAVLNGTVSSPNRVSNQYEQAFQATDAQANPCMLDILQPSRNPRPVRLTRTTSAVPST